MDKETTINNTKDAKPHNTSNAVAKLNINSNNLDATPSLNSDGEQQSSQESTVTTKTKLDHTKAEQIYQNVGFDDTLYSSIIKKMGNYITFPGFISNSCREIVQESEEKTKDALAPQLIALAEVINKGFEDDNVKQRIQRDTNFNDKSADELFEIILDNIHYGLLREIENNVLKEIDCQNIIGEVYACYGIE